MSDDKFIDIVFDGPPSHESGRFVEVESPSGTSISFGEWVQRPDGYWALRFPDLRAERDKLTGTAFSFKCRAETAEGRARELEAALTKIRDLRAGHQLGGCDTPEDLANAYGRIASTAWETAAAALAKTEAPKCETKGDDRG